MDSASCTLALNFGFSFEDLYDQRALARLDESFLEHLKTADAGLAERLLTGRREPATLPRKAQSELILDVAPYLEDFIGRLFGITEEVDALRARHDELAPIYFVKRNFVQRKALTGVTKEAASAIDGGEERSELERLFGEELTERSYAEHVATWLKTEELHKPELDVAAKYAAWAMLAPEGIERHRHGVLFKAPHKLDMNHLVPVEPVEVNGAPALRLHPSHWRHREGFELTDPGTDLLGALDNAAYCIKCHNQGKDSCSTGLKEKNGTFKSSPFGVTLAGCPLEEKISELNVLKQRGYSIGGLAVVTIDNPMAAATGHRICNDCMKACIYQKQDPVDIPQVETRTLKDVLELPWGFEIYGLLTRWNPLNLRQPMAKPDSGKKVLVAGLGPAGFTLAHYMLNEGHTVAAVDGLKIEPLPAEFSGRTPAGAPVPFRPIRDVKALFEGLDHRVMAGFGGVAEYGITVRWDKNFLKIIRLLLERRERFAMFGGVRLGGTVTLEQAFALGFDHVAMCLGAGKPTILDLPNALAPGVRMASDFLMALQLTGAAKSESIANLQLRLPVVVIGGGLTAIDTATEALAYYPLQVEKFLHRYETLVAERGEAAVRRSWSQTEAAVAEDFIAHARAIRAERIRAADAGEAPRIVALLDGWGGVTIAYRRRLIDSPSYTLNHEEVEKALQEGIRFAEGLTPTAIQVDGAGHATAVEFEAADAGMARLPAHAVLVAAGTRPNTVLAREDAAHIRLDGQYFAAVDEEGAPTKPEKLAKPALVRVLQQIRPDGRAVSFFGDLHPSFAGNVVKA